jgi:hypothetical protein
MDWFGKKSDWHWTRSESGEKFMAQSVFLIHDELEKPFARQLAIDLSLAGATVWLDEAEAGGLQNSLGTNINRKIQGDIYLAVILTPNSVRSDWVRHEVEIALNRQEDGFVIKVLPLLYKDCAIPAFMTDNLCADFRDPANYSIMLRKVIDGLGHGGNGNGPVVPASLAGMWQGSWIWCGRQRDVNMFLSASPAIPSKMIIRYLKSGILTIVEQQLEVRISGNAVKLIGTSYRLIERGISVGWNLDTFNLTRGKTGTTLEGINTDKRGAQSTVMFKRI